MKLLNTHLLLYPIISPDAFNILLDPHGPLSVLSPQLLRKRDLPLLFLAQHLLTIPRFSTPLYSVHFRTQPTLPLTEGNPSPIIHLWMQRDHKEREEGHCFAKESWRFRSARGLLQGPK